MSFPTLGQIDAKLQLRLKNVVNSPFSQDTRVSAINDVIDYLQSKANWNSTKQVTPFDFLTREPDYSLEDDLGITDFKQYKDLRFINDSERNNTKEFQEIDTVDFAIFEGQGSLVNRVAFEDRDGDTMMRILSSWGQGDTVIDEMDDLTTGRTWASDTTNSDATTLAADTTRVKVGGSCLKFNISVTQSANNRAAIFTSTSFTVAIDASDELNNGYFRLWLGLHSLTAAQLALLTSVTFIWGSESSVTPASRAHFWSRTSTTPVNNGSFKAGWNRMSFDWANATKTGSPDEAALKYFEVTLNFAAAMTNANNIRVDQIKMFAPNEMELVFYGLNMVQVGTSKQQHFTTSIINTSEILLFPFQHINLFLNLAASLLWPQKQKNDRDYIRVKSDIKEQLALAINQSGEAITRATEQLNVEGLSSGRSDVSGGQW